LLSVASKRHPDLGVTFATTVSEWLQRGQANVRCSQLGFFVGSMPSTNIANRIWCTAVGQSARVRHEFEIA